MIWMKVSASVGLIVFVCITIKFSIYRAKKSELNNIIKRYKEMTNRVKNDDLEMSELLQLKTSILNERIGFYGAGSSDRKSYIECRRALIMVITDQININKNLNSQ